ncbi:MAG: hypothetical protein EOM23_07780 [Candidatus Moranbacteria bacterium]|nr:hypothetical protein [Candidatus Moranbacteria bacterium]
MEEIMWGRFLTSVYVNDERKAKIVAVALFLGVSRNRIICLLLDRLMQDYEFMYQRKRTVEYQPDQPKEEWSRMSVRFHHASYEKYTDVRKISKISVSFLLAIAVDKYLEELLLEMVDTSVKRTEINYSITFHEIRYNIYENCTEWLFCWEENPVPLLKQRE